MMKIFKKIALFIFTFITTLIVCLIVITLFLFYKLDIDSPSKTQKQFIIVNASDEIFKFNIVFNSDLVCDEILPPRSNKLIKRELIMDSAYQIQYSIGGKIGNFTSPYDSGNGSEFYSIIVSKEKVFSFDTNGGWIK